MRKKQSELNATNLKQVLWQTLNEVRAKKIDVSTANAVALASKEIMSVVNAEIRIASMGADQFQNFVGGSPMVEGRRRHSRLK